MKYIHLHDNKVHEIIDEIDPVHPNVPIKDRYAKDFLEACIVVKDNKVPEIGDVYVKGTTFAKPEPVIAPPPPTLEEQKAALELALKEINAKIKGA